MYIYSSKDKCINIVHESSLYSQVMHSFSGMHVRDSCILVVNHVHICHMLSCMIWKINSILFYSLPYNQGWVLHIFFILDFCGRCSPKATRTGACGQYFRPHPVADTGISKPWGAVPAW